MKRNYKPGLIKMYLGLGVFFIFFHSCTSEGQRTHQESEVKKTKETMALYKNLSGLAKHHTLFGHQDDMAYGVNWQYQPGKSDVMSVVGEYPALFGWDIGGIELAKAKNLDGVPFSKMREYIIKGYRQGAAITISWHMRNPLTNGNSWDTSKNSVASILPDGKKHRLYLKWLDRAAVFIESLKDTDGTPIPILFRPFHELTGNWFWWCEAFSSPQQFKELWRFTVRYMEKNKGLHNLLWVYCTTDIYSVRHFEERYPGNDVVDVIGMDAYQHGPKESREEYIDKVRKSLSVLDSVATVNEKLLAFTETGYEAIPDKGWWTKTLLPAMEGFPVAWVLVWRNHGYMESTNRMHYYAPYPGQISAADFKNFYHTPGMFFEQDAKEKQLYSLGK